MLTTNNSTKISCSAIFPILIIYRKSYEDSQSSDYLRAVWILSQLWLNRNFDWSNMYCNSDKVSVSNNASVGLRAMTKYDAWEKIHLELSSTQKADLWIDCYLQRILCLARREKNYVLWADAQYFAITAGFPLKSDTILVSQRLDLSSAVSIMIRSQQSNKEYFFWAYSGTCAECHTTSWLRYWLCYSYSMLTVKLFQNHHHHWLKKKSHEDGTNLCKIRLTQQYLLHAKVVTCSSKECLKTLQQKVNYHKSIHVSYSILRKRNTNRRWLGRRTINVDIVEEVL